MIGVGVSVWNLNKTGGGSPSPSTAGQPIGLLLILTKAS